jgi:hypothetical protein
MRSLLSILAVGLIASTAMASGTVSVIGPGGVDTYIPAAGETFTVEVHAEAPGPMTSISAFIEVPAGFEIAASELAEPFPGYIFIANYTDQLGVNSNNWSPSPSLAYGWDAGTQMEIYGVPVGDGGTATSGFVLWLDITAPADASAIGGSIDVVTPLIYVDYDEVPGVTGQNLLLPEPASALLLLAGLPLLRRRR